MLNLQENSNINTLTTSATESNAFSLPAGKDHHLSIFQFYQLIFFEFSVHVRVCVALDFLPGSLLCIESMFYLAAE